MRPIRGRPDLPPPPSPDPGRNFVLDANLRGFLETNKDVVRVIRKPVNVNHVGALAAQSDQPLLFENIVGRPGFRVLDILVKNRNLQARALGVGEDEVMKTLAYRLRQPPRGIKQVRTGPVKEVVIKGADLDVRTLPILFQSETNADPMMTCMNWVKDPDSGRYNTMNALTTFTGPTSGFSLFVSRDTTVIFEKYKARGIREVPIAFVIGVPPAYEIMANYAGVHMDSWGEVEMFGTIMNQDVELVPCETIDLMVPAVAEIVVEGYVLLDQIEMHDCGPSPMMYGIPAKAPQPAVRFTAVTMRKDRPIYRAVQTVPETDHQPLPRLCHEAILYNRLVEMGVAVKDVMFPTWGGAMSCILQIAGVPRDGVIADALMALMSTPYNNAKLAVAVSADTDIADPGAVYHAITLRADPGRDVFIVPRTRGHPGDPSATPIPGDPFNRLAGKMAIDATIKSRLNVADFERAWPRDWGKVDLADYLD
ncbi:MAG: UbiD family decarboxylase [Alphaproteobacteria bacterium]|nr:UbiD family decarboxylase [Alphaproteobacteria bacterium]